MASHLFFPHFFDWWSWRSSFASVNLSIHAANQTSRNSELQDICNQHGRREASPLTTWILDILVCMTYVKRPVQDLDAWGGNREILMPENAMFGQVAMIPQAGLNGFGSFHSACHLLYIRKVTAFIPDGTRDIYEA